MQYEEFFASLKRGEAARAYLFSGEEQLIKASALDELRARLLEPGFAAFNEGAPEPSASAARIIDEAEALPMMGGKRLVVVRDWIPLTSAKARDEAADAEMMAKWLDDPPETCCLVFMMTGAADGRKAMTREVSKRAVSVEFALLDEDAATAWMNRRLKKSGARIERAAAERLLFLSGRALAPLAGELDKLASYVADRGLITEEDVDLLVSPTAESAIFQMTDRLLAGDMARAQVLLKGLLESGETRLGVIASLTRQLRQMAHISAMRAAGAPDGKIEKSLGMSRYALRKASERTAGFPRETLEACYRACVDADYAIKSGQAQDVSALGALILRLGTIRASNKRV